MKSFLRYIGYITFKWIVLYIYMAFKSDGNWNWENINSKESLFFTLWMILALPIMEMLILAIPVHFITRLTGEKMIMLMLLTLGLEFAMGWFATNQKLAPWMFIKLILSAGAFVLFYHKSILETPYIKNSG